MDIGQFLIRCQSHTPLSPTLSRHREDKERAVLQVQPAARGPTGEVGRHQGCSTPSQTCVLLSSQDQTKASPTACREGGEGMTLLNIGLRSMDPCSGQDQASSSPWDEPQERFGAIEQTRIWGGVAGASSGLLGSVPPHTSQAPPPFPCACACVDVRSRRDRNAAMPRRRVPTAHSCANKRPTQASTLSVGSARRDLPLPDAMHAGQRQRSQPRLGKHPAYLFDFPTDAGCSCSTLPRAGVGRAAHKTTKPISVYPEPTLYGRAASSLPAAARHACVDFPYHHDPESRLPSLTERPVGPTPCWSWLGTSGSKRIRHFPGFG